MLMFVVQIQLKASLLHPFLEGLGRHFTNILPLT
jgi:hypothetical protein